MSFVKLSFTTPIDEILVNYTCGSAGLNNLLLFNLAVASSFPHCQLSLILD